MDTGALVTVVQREEGTVTVKIEGSAIRGLKGRAFVTVDGNTHASIDDEVWSQVLGRGTLVLPGGTEIDVIDEELGELAQTVKDQERDPKFVSIPLRVRDIYMPPCRVLIPLWMLREHCNPIEPGDGPRADGELERCTHPGDQLAGSECRFCFWRWWRTRALAAGMEV